MGVGNFHKMVEANGAMGVRRPEVTGRNRVDALEIKRIGYRGER